MVLSKLKNIKQSSGFTIVELLIVIVVIGILAAITIVAYGGITARANTTKAQTNGANTQKVAEAYNADAGYYPPSLASFAAGFGSTPSSKLPTGITVIAGLPQAGGAGAGAAETGTQPLSATNGLTTVSYSCRITCTTSTGGRIGYWDFTAAARVFIYVGVASATDASAYVAAA